MSKPAVVSILGTRPEVIKLAPVINALRRFSDVSCRVWVTAQHRELLDLMLRSFKLKADVDLNLMRPNQSFNTFGGQALLKMGELLREQRPALVLVQGDTTTAMVGALAAFHEKIPVGHVEAGLRTFDCNNPFPEEINRVFIDKMAALHFAPTEAAAKNLRRERLSSGHVLVTGNTVIDALKWAIDNPKPVREPMLRRSFAALGAKDQAVLVTTHRRENLGETIDGFCRAFKKLVLSYPQLHLFYPVHLNPNIALTVNAKLRHPRIHLLPPLDYFDLVRVLKRCRFVMTDSGGIQEEAAFLGKPILVLRRITERPEAVAAGVACVAGVKEDDIFALASRLIEDNIFYRKMARRVTVFGDGRASQRIARDVRRYLNLTRTG